MLSPPSGWITPIQNIPVSSGPPPRCASQNTSALPGHSSTASAAPLLPHPPLPSRYAAHIPHCAGLLYPAAPPPLNVPLYTPPSSLLIMLLLPSGLPPDSLLPIQMP